MIFVTACDEEYYPYLKRQVGNIYLLFNKMPIVFDLGLGKYKWNLLMAGVEVHSIPIYMEPADTYPGTYRPKALYKPYILKNVARHNPSQDILYMDADARPIRHFIMPDHDIIAAAVNEERLAKYRGTDMEAYVGPVHSGVVYLGATETRMDFIQEWIDDMEKDPMPSDKKSFNSVIKERDVHIMPENIFDSRERTKETWILHRK
jgi:hypothetical protein